MSLIIPPTPNFYEPDPARALGQQRQTWLETLRAEVPIIRRGLLRITVPAVGANAIVHGLVSFSSVPSAGQSGPTNTYTTVEDRDEILSAWIDNPPLYAAPPVILAHVNVQSATQLLCTWSNPTAAAYAGGTVDYEALVLKYSKVR